LARRLAHRYAGRGVSADDLAQCAALGLIQAVDRFDPKRGQDFASFAVPTILGEIRRYFRDRTWSVRVPRRVQQLHLAISRANNTLPVTLGRSPTVTDIAAFLDISEEDVLEGLEGGDAYTAKSLATPAGVEDGLMLGDTLGAEDHGYESVEARVVVGPALETLDERDQTILRLRFYDNLTQSQIADRIGVSQMHVSRLISKALATLRTRITVDND
jgi:RNA polymerase sigma-B factor